MDAGSNRRKVDYQLLDFGLKIDNYLEFAFWFLLDHEDSFISNLWTFSFLRAALRMMQ
jgi:hypothetical protein